MELTVIPPTSGNWVVCFFLGWLLDSVLNLASGCRFFAFILDAAFGGVFQKANQCILCRSSDRDTNIDVHLGYVVQYFYPWEPLYHGLQTSNQRIFVVLYQFGILPTMNLP